MPHGITTRRARSGRIASRVRLTRMHPTYILMHMRSTLNLSTDLLDHASRLTGITQKTALIHAGLEALIARESAKRLAALGGKDPAIRATPRRRSDPAKGRAA